MFKKYLYGFGIIRIMQAIGRYFYLYEVKGKKEYIDKAPKALITLEHLISEYNGTNGETTNTSEIKQFLNQDGKIKLWPSKKMKKDKIIEYLSEKFEAHKIYTEKEINEILNNWHTFNDSPLLRRELFERKYLDRKRDCSEYWVNINKN